MKVKPVKRGKAFPSQIDKFPLTTEIKSHFEVVILANNNEYKGAGKTLEEALANIVPPEKFFGEVYMRITIDGQTRERAMRPAQMWKLFNPDFQELVLNQIRILFEL